MTSQNAKTIRLKADTTVPLPVAIPEGSGAATWKQNILVHNDSSDPNLYELNNEGEIVNKIALPAQNVDWEDMAQDSLYFYIGDFGNNFGNRDTLKIIKLDKVSISSGELKVESIFFTWPEITRVKTNFDCEAMIVAGDSIYLFTKEWRKNRRTQMFSIPKNPGLHQARFQKELKTRVIVTGASFHEGSDRLVLLGHNLWVRPFLLLFEGVEGFKSGKYKKYKIRKHFRQVEAIDTYDGKIFYVISELFCLWAFGTTQEMMTVTIED